MHGDTARSWLERCTRAPRRGCARGRGDWRGPCRPRTALGCEPANGCGTARCAYRVGVARWPLPTRQQWAGGANGTSLLAPVGSRESASAIWRWPGPPPATRTRPTSAKRRKRQKGKALHVPYFCRIAGAAFGSIRICSLLALQSKTLTGRETSRREPRTRYLRAFFIRSGLWRGMMRCVRLFRFIYRIYSQLGRIKRVKTSSPKESGRAEGPRAPASPSPLPCGPSGPCPVMVYGLWNGYTPVVQMSGMGSGSGKRMQKRAIQHA